MSLIWKGHVRFRGDHRIEIPKSLRERLGLEPGFFVEIDGYGPGMSRYPNGDLVHPCGWLTVTPRPTLPDPIAVMTPAREAW